MPATADSGNGWRALMASPRSFLALPEMTLPHYLGWQRALAGERIASPKRFLRAAIGLIHT